MSSADAMAGSPPPGAADSVPARESHEGWDEQPIAVDAVADLFRRRGKWLVGLALLGFLIGVIVAKTAHQIWVAQATVVPYSQTSRGSQLAGLAAQFGLNIGSSDIANSPELYAELTQSRDLLREVAMSEYEVLTEEGTLKGDLIDVYEIEGETPEVRIRSAVGRLSSALSVRIDRAAGVIEVEVEAAEQDLAVQIADRIIELLNEFNLRRRVDQIAAEQAFIRDRMEEAERDLLAAEDSLTQFLEENRRISGSPALQARVARLERRVNFRQQVHLSLVQAFEQARLEQLRTTPVLLLLEHPEYTVRRGGAGALLLGIFGLILGGMIGAVAGLVFEYYAGSPISRVAP